jgi:multidrug efflux pump subunit AcrA (membrane-fusion protein)
VNRFLVIIMLFITLLSLQACQQEHQNNSATVKLGTVDVTIAASGELESKKRAFLGPPTIPRMWQHQIKQMLPENSHVKKGQMVVAFDDKKVQERLRDKLGKQAQAQKELENKKRQEVAEEQKLVLALAEKNMDYKKAQRKAEIVDNSSSKVDQQKAQIDFTIAKNDLTLATKVLQFHRDNTLLNIKLAQAKLDRLTSKVNALKGYIERLKVKAPMDGLVIYKNDWNGEKPSVGGSVQMGQSVIELAVIEQMQVKAQIDEPDSGNVQVGQVVNITFDSAKDKLFKGKIASLGKVFREKSWQDKRKVFDVIIALDTIDAEVMRPGMTARIEVIQNTLTNVLILPQKAIKHIKNHDFVTLIKTFGDENIPVLVSRVVNNKAVIIRGLQAGDQVTL